MAPPNFAEKKQTRGGESSFISTTRCLKATVRVLSFIIDRTNPARPEYIYSLEINPAKGRAIEATATGPDLASPRRLKEWFATYAKLTWEGDAKSGTAFCLAVTDSKQAPEVRQLTQSGYQIETENYIFAKWGVDKSGKFLVPDKRGHFQTGYNRFFRVPAHAEEKAITPSDISQEKVKDIYGAIKGGWGLNGVVAFSWTLASLFVNQLKAALDFFPFLSLYGDPASGKSALVTILNHIQGRDLEGLPITQLNSRKGLTRTISQLSGQFTALLEDSQRNEKGFDYSILLTAYNRGPLQVQAAFSNDLQTKESPFLGTLLFCQNVEPFNSKQEKQRIISLPFHSDQLTDSSRAAYTKIIAMGKNDLAGVLRQVLTHRQHFESSWEKEYIRAIENLGQMEERRILQNHALILAFHRLFCSCFVDHAEDVTSYFRELGQQKCQSSAIRQTTLADHFFELLDTVDEDKLLNTCHFDTDKGHMYINLPRAENLIRNKGVNLQITESLSMALQRHPAYIRNSVKYRFPNDPEKDAVGRTRQRKVWVFDLTWFQEKEAKTINTEVSK